MDNSRIVHFSTPRANFDICSRTLVVSAGFNGFCHSVYLLSLKMHILYHIYEQKSNTHTIYCVSDKSYLSKKLSNGASSLKKVSITNRAPRRKPVMKVSSSHSPMNSA